eukprot:366175-Chlamydomonas_euryale.AAC.9
MVEAGGGGRQRLQDVCMRAGTGVRGGCNTLEDVCMGDTRHPAARGMRRALDCMLNAGLPAFAA